MLSSLDVKAEYLAEVKALLAKHLPQAEVWAYGSRVSGGCHAGSDLDLVVRNPADLEQRHESLAAFKQVIMESNIPILIDIMDWAVLPEAFRQEIIKKHCVVQQVGCRGLEKIVVK